MLKSFSPDDDIPYCLEYLEKYALYCENKKLYKLVKKVIKELKEM